VRVLTNDKKSRRHVCAEWGRYITLSLTSAALTPLKAIMGTVLDSEGASVGGAHILIHPDLSRSEFPHSKRDDIFLNSDSRGRFETQLEPGFFDVCVMADAFTPQCRKVYIMEARILQIVFRLRADPEVVRRIGDKF